MEPSQPEVAVVILNWNGLSDTLACLASVQSSSYSRLRIIVADNGSADGSVAAIGLQHPAVHVIENGENIGFAAGNNTAISYALAAGVDFVFLLNNDTVIASDCISAFVEAAELMPDAGIFGAKIYYFDQKDTIWYAGGYWDQHAVCFGDYGANEKDCGQYDRLVETDWVIGCAMFIRAKVFREIGLLEPKYFLNYEEIDFCFRARRAGLLCAFVPTAKLWHKVSVSFGGDDTPLKIYFNERNRLLWAQRNSTLRVQLIFHWRAVRLLFRKFTRALFGLTLPGRLTPKAWWWALLSECRDPRNYAMVRGYVDFWLRKFGDCPGSVRTLNSEWLARRAMRQSNDAHRSD